MTFLRRVCPLRPTCFSVGTQTDKRRNAVDTRGAWTARCCSAVIDVLRAVRAAPAVNTHTAVAANQIAAGPSILAGVWLQATLIHIFCTVLACGQKCRKGEEEDNQNGNMSLAWMQQHKSGVLPRAQTANWNVNLS